MGCGQASPVSKIETGDSTPKSYPSPYPVYTPYPSATPSTSPTPAPSPTSATAFYTKCVALSSCKKLSTAVVSGECLLYAKKTKTYKTEAQLDKALKRCKK